MKIKPDYRIHSLFDISAEFIKENHIELLFVDVDNTLVSPYESQLSEQSRKWIAEMQQQTHLIFISNNRKKRVAAIVEDVGEYASFAMKPFGFFAYRKAKKRKVDSTHVACVGDQWITDVLGAHFHGFISILCDPLTEKDLIYTKLTRNFENKILHRLEKQNEKM